VLKFAANEQLYAKQKLISSESVSLQGIELKYCLIENKNNWTSNNIDNSQIMEVVYAFK